MTVMPVFRVEKNQNYTTMCNVHLKDKSLSLKAKGLLSQILSLPDDWDYSVRGLVAICMEGKDCIVSVLQELERNGYLERNQLRNPDGRLGGIEYVIYEAPEVRPCTESPCAENPDTVIPDAEEPDVENPPQLSTNIQNTKEIKYQRIKEPRHRYGMYENVLLSDADMQKLQDEFPADYKERIERLSEYIASSGRSYKNHLATIRSWARKEKPAADKKKKYGEPGYYDFKEGDSL